MSNRQIFVGFLLISVQLSGMTLRRLLVTKAAAEARFRHLQGLSTQEYRLKSLGRCV